MNAPHNRYERFDHGAGLVGWSYRYTEVAPRSKRGEVSTGLEVAVQLSGSWHHDGLRSGRREYGAGSLFTISPSETYGFSFAARSAPVIQVGFIAYPDEIADLAGLDRDIVFPQAPIDDADFVSLCREFQRALDLGSPLPGPEVASAVRSFIDRHAVLEPRDLLVNAKRFLDVHFDRALYLKHIAEIAGMHPTTFLRRFAHRFGVTPIHYRLLLRLNAAARLTWSQPTLTTSEIAAQVGFEDIAYFHRSFRKRFGISPAAYGRARR